VFIKAALDAGKPPTAMILSDPDHTEWDRMDYHMVKAYHMKQGFMSGNFPVWIDRSDRVIFEMKSFISKSTAASERKQLQESKGGKSPTPGQQWYPVPVTIDGGPLPTYAEWAEEQAEKEGRERPRRGPAQSQ
jgi:hypothetical protein